MKVMARYTEIISAKMEERIKGCREPFGCCSKQRSQGDGAQGCLLVNTAVELSNHDPVAVAKVKGFINNERLLEQLARTRKWRNP
jgi:TetR/AcrR family transcriptional repressor of nem operon